MSSIKSSKSKIFSDPQEYDHRIFPPEGDHDFWSVCRVKDGEWKFVKMFDTEKQAQDWLKGGIPSYRSLR